MNMRNINSGCRASVWMFCRLKLRVNIESIIVDKSTPSVGLDRNVVEWLKAKRPSEQSRSYYLGFSFTGIDGMEYSQGRILSCTKWQIHKLDAFVKNWTSVCCKCLWDKDQVPINRIRESELQEWPIRFMSKFSWWFFVFMNSKGIKNAVTQL